MKDRSLWIHEWIESEDVCKEMETQDDIVLEPAVFDDIELRLDRWLEQHDR